MKTVIWSSLQSMLGAFTFVSFLQMLYWRNYYTWHLPRTLDLKNGRVIPLSLEHGIVVFATALERQKLQDTWHWACLGFGSLLLALWLDFFFKLIGRKIS